MSKEAPHFGTYQWTRTETEANPRPMSGSIAHLQAESAWLEERKANLLTPQGQAWLRRHEASK